MTTEGEMPFKLDLAAVGWAAVREQLVDRSDRITAILKRLATHTPYHFTHDLERARTRSREAIEALEAAEKAWRAVKDRQWGKATVATADDRDLRASARSDVGAVDFATMDGFKSVSEYAPPREVLRAVEELLRPTGAYVVTCNREDAVLSFTLGKVEPAKTA